MSLVVVGGQFGDEGKGKIVDLLSERAEVVVRYQGGNNAGHTVRVCDEEFILHLIPSGILHGGVRCILGNGMVVDPVALASEIGELERRGVDLSGRLFVSGRAHTILPHHKLLDASTERARGKTKIGTTGKGIGPAYTDKAARRGIRMADMLDKSLFETKLRRAVEEKNRRSEALFGERGPTTEEVLEMLRPAVGKIAPYVCDAAALLWRWQGEEKRILFEGAQGTLLDVDFGTYPYVTSSNASAGGACTGSGIGPAAIDSVMGIFKAYTTRVGEGPFPTEIEGERGEALRERGREYGATTGRPRRCGWFDAVLGAYSARVNGLDRIALTKADVLSGEPVLRICTAYRIGDRILEEFPQSTESLFRCEPVYEEHPGWKEDLSGVRGWEEFPVSARSYFERIAELLGARLSIVSVGPGREESILLQTIF